MKSICALAHSNNTGICSNMNNTENDRRYEILKLFLIIAQCCLPTLTFWSKTGRLSDNLVN